MYNCVCKCMSILFQTVITLKPEPGTGAWYLLSAASQAAYLIVEGILYIAVHVRSLYLYCRLGFVRCKYLLFHKNPAISAESSLIGLKVQMQKD